MRRITFLITLVVLHNMPVWAQQKQISIEECYKMARENFPVIKKQNILAQTAAYSVENAGKAYLPQLSVSGQASYQSQVLGFGDVLGNILPPGVEVPALSKDQYKLQADINQAIYDGGATRYQKKMVEANEALQQQQVEVMLYTINDRVNQLYFSILLMEQQNLQNEIRKSDIRNGIDKVTAAFNNGTAYRSNVDELKAELVNADMAGIELKANKVAYLQMLSLLTGMELSEDTQLVLPEARPLIAETNNRPELKLYELQKALYETEQRKIKTGYMPKFNLFFQGGYGRPTLNMIENKFGSWYITGARFNWNFGSLYSLKNDKRIIRLNQQAADVDKETFLYNTNITAGQQQTTLKKYQQLLKEDEKLIMLRTSVKNAAEAQLENGVITTRDFIAHVNAENIARQTLLLHSIQLLQTQFNLNYTKGN